MPPPFEPVLAGDHTRDLLLPAYTQPDAPRQGVVACRVLSR